MKAHAVIGANYGDEGKGLMTDFLCHDLNATLVVRYCGGAQAGHTVVTPEGRQHVFHHRGCGNFLGIPTFLSKYFIVNPLLFLEERGATTGTITYVDPRAIVTTPLDMLINQAWHKKKGQYNSCGIGINETMQRSKHPELLLTVNNMVDEQILKRIWYEYTPYRLTSLALDNTIFDLKHWWNVYLEHAKYFKQLIIITTTPSIDYSSILFEGAQGLMLSQDSPDFPFVTHAYTGSRNVLDICDEWNINDIRLTYVTRSYLTRHGAGPLPNEQPLPAWLKDETNIMNPYQGPLRYAPLDKDALKKRILKDAGNVLFNVALTCMDQKIIVLEELPVMYFSYGRTRNDVQKRQICTQKCMGI